MTRRFCDKCKREIADYKWGQVRFPMVFMNVTREDALMFPPNDVNKHVDLCPDCQREVYEFVFGESAE